LPASVGQFLKELGFRARAFHRTTSDGITQVIEFQLARFDPPAHGYVGFRQNPYGKFTVNVGVYVPELHAYGYTGGGKLAFIHEYDGWVGERLGILGPERQDLWWDLKAVHEQAAEVFRRIERDAFLSSQSSKEKDTDFSRFTRSRQNLACAIVLRTAA